MLSYGNDAEDEGTAGAAEAPAQTSREDGRAAGEKAAVGVRDRQQAHVGR